MRVLFYFESLIKELKNKRNYRFEDSLIYSNSIFNKFYILKQILKVQKVNFCSNNYLNLSENYYVKKEGIKALKQFGAGASSSKFITGYHHLYTLIENVIKQNKMVDDCVIFNSGYNANIGIFESLFDEKDIIFLDEKSHASSFVGVKLSGARMMRFKHNSISDLKHKIQQFRPKEGGKIGIATETVFSMHGSVLKDVEEYFNVANQHEAILITDEAHSLGLFKFNFPSYNLHIQIGTFSKAVGVLGGYVCGNKILIDAIRQFSKSGIYTTALPPSVLASVLKSLRLIFENKINGDRALNNAKFFGKILDIEVLSHIIFLEVESNEKALLIEQALLNQGFIVKAIRRPTVKQAGIRISFNNLHKMVDIKKLAFIIKEYL